MVQSTRPHNAGVSWRRGPVCFLGCCLLLCGLIVLPNCSERENYKTLSFFFDGVPDPNAPPPQLDAEGNPVNAPSRPGSRGVAIASVHKPYKENKCDSCHVGAANTFESFTQLSSSVCMNCHKQVPVAYAVMHGPVASGACLMCHDPHESSQQHLLKVAPPDLCLQCHQRQDLGPPVQAHADVAANCLDCHVGHGGNKHGLLRDVAVLGTKGTPPNDPALPATDAAPTPAPAPAPAGGQP